MTHKVGCFDSNQFKHNHMVVCADIYIHTHTTGARGRHAYAQTRTRQ